MPEAPGPRIVISEDNAAGGPLILVGAATATSIAIAYAVTVATLLTSAFARAGAATVTIRGT